MFFEVIDEGDCPKKKGNNFLKFLLIFLTLIFFNGKNLYSDFVMPISADLDYYNLNIGYEFSGDYLTLFGAKENLERMAVVMYGPERNYLITKREKIFNLWIKRTTKIFENVPSYYASWISNDLRRDRDVIDFYDLDPRSAFNLYDQEDFVDSFLSDMQDKRGLYHNYEIINSANNNLFKVNLFLPNNATIGNYLLNVMSINEKNNVDGRVIMSFNIAHSDFNHFIYRMNKESPKLYAMFLVIFAFLSIGVIRYFY